MRTLALVLAALGSAGSDPGSLRVPQPTGQVYEVRVSMRGHVWREWVAPRSGHCRRDGEQVEISTATIRVVISPPSWGALAGASVRKGSPRFVRGTLGRECAALGASLRTGEPARVRWRGAEGSVAVVEELTATEAIQRRLFAIGSARVRSYDVEHTASGKPRFPVGVYWLGRAYRDRRAIRAVEHYDRYDARAPANRVYITFYSRPSDVRSSSALPGSGSPPRSELQVTNAPATARLSRRTIEHFERAHRRHGWPRIPLRTADGARAVLYLNLGEGRPFTNFTVRVGRTLVGVSAGRGLTEAEARTIARNLRRR